MANHNSRTNGYWYQHQVPDDQRIKGLIQWENSLEKDLIVFSWQRLNSCWEHQCGQFVKGTAGSPVMERQHEKLLKFLFRRLYNGRLVAKIFYHACRSNILLLRTDFVRPMRLHDRQQPWITSYNRYSSSNKHVSSRQGATSTHRGPFHGPKWPLNRWQTSINGADADKNTVASDWQSYNDDPIVD